MNTAQGTDGCPLNNVLRCTEPGMSAGGQARFSKSGYPTEMPSITLNVFCPEEEMASELRSPISGYGKSIKHRISFLGLFPFLSLSEILYISTFLPQIKLKPSLPTTQP